MAIETVPGYEFVCQRPGCGTRSPALRPTRQQAEDDERAHENIVHADEPAMEPTSPEQPSNLCPQSGRVDGEHSWGFDGDDPRIICHWCDEMRDALSGRVLRAGRPAAPNAEPTSSHV